MEQTVKSFLSSLPYVLESIEPAAVPVISDLVLHNIRTVMCDEVLERGLRRVLVKAIAPLAKVSAGLCPPGELHLLLKPATEMLNERYWPIGLDKGSSGSSSEPIKTLAELLHIMNLLNSSAMLTPPSTPSEEKKEFFPSANALGGEEQRLQGGALISNPRVTLEPPTRITYSRKELLELKHRKMIVKFPAIAYLLGIVKEYTGEQCRSKGSQQTSVTRADLVERWEHDLFDPNY